MSEFVITNNNGMYLFYDKLKKLCYTDKIDTAARFPSESKAYNVLTCSFPKKKREGWTVQEVKPKEEIQHMIVQTDDGTERFRAETTINDEQSLDWNAISQMLEQIYAEVVTYKNDIHIQLTNVEAELCDCEHACEFFKYNASEGYKLYSMIRTRRMKRRHLKNEYRKATAVLNMSCDNIADGGLEKVFKEIDEQSYEPRVLKDLFKILRNLKCSQGTQEMDGIAGVMKCKDVTKEEFDEINKKDNGNINSAYNVVFNNIDGQRRLHKLPTSRVWEISYIYDMGRY